MALVAVLARRYRPARASGRPRRRLRMFVEQQPLPFDGEVEIVVGEPDPRLNLAACRQYEPFIPTGARLWGRASLGVRCVDGAQWTAYIPVQIKVYGPGLVAARPIARGQPLTIEDFRHERVEWTQWAPGMLAVAPDQADGRVATRGIQPGEALRRDMLRAQPVFVAGEPIRIVYAGPGFAGQYRGQGADAGQRRADRAGGAGRRPGRHRGRASRQGPRGTLTTAREMTPMAGLQIPENRSIMG